jgi:hypothetical protein
MYISEEKFKKYTKKYAAFLNNFRSQCCIVDVITMKRSLVKWIFALGRPICTIYCAVKRPAHEDELASPSVSRL